MICNVMNAGKKNECRWKILNKNKMPLCQATVLLNFFVYSRTTLPPTSQRINTSPSPKRVPYPRGCANVFHKGLAVCKCSVLCNSVCCNGMNVPASQSTGNLLYGLEWVCKLTKIKLLWCCRYTSLKRIFFFFALKEFTKPCYVIRASSAEECHCMWKVRWVDEKSSFEMLRLSLLHVFLQTPCETKHWQHACVFLT